MMFQMRLRGEKAPLYTGIFLLTLKYFFSISAIFPCTDLLDSILSALGIFCVMTAVLVKRCTLTNVIIYCVVALYSVITCVNSSSYHILITVITCMAISQEDFDDVARFMFRCQATLFIVQLIVACLASFVSDYAIFTQTERNSMRFNGGFVHTNSYSLYLANLITIWLWLNYGKIKGKELFFLGFLTLLSAYLTKNRTQPIVIVAILILVAIYQKKANATLFLNLCTRVFFFCCAIAIWWLVVKYNDGHPLSLAADSILSSRIRLGTYAYNHYGFTLIGRNLQNLYVSSLELGLKGWFTFDNMYTFLMFNQGAFWIPMLVIAFWCFSRTNNSKLMILGICWALYGISEVLPINGYLFFPALLFSFVINKRNNRVNTVYDSKS